MKALGELQGVVTSMDVAGPYLYTTCSDGIQVWDRQDLRLVREQGGFRRNLRLCVDERWIYCTSIYHFTVIDPRTLEMVHEAQFGQDISSDLGRPRQDGQRVYFPIRNGPLAVVEKADFNQAQVIQHHESSVWGMAVDDQHLYTASVDKTVKVWDKASLEVVRVLEGHKDNVQRVVVDDRYLLSGSSDLSAILWDKASSEIVQRVRKAHKRTINNLLLWPETFVTASQAEGKVRVWDTASGALKKELDLCVSEAGGFLVDGERVFAALKRPERVEIFPLELFVPG
jgi:WD40 repeat protein